MSSGIIRRCGDTVPLSLRLGEKTGNRKRCRQFEWSIFLAFQKWHSVIIASRERNSVVSWQHWQAITQSENWMAVLIQIFPFHTTNLYNNSSARSVYLMHLTIYMQGLHHPLNDVKQSSSCWCINKPSCIQLFLCEPATVYVLSSFPTISLSQLKTSLSILPRADNYPIYGPTLHLLSFLNLPLPLSRSPSFYLKSQRSDLVRRRLKLWLRVCVIFVAVCTFIWQGVSVWGPEASLVSLPACLPPN